MVLEAQNSYDRVDRARRKRAHKAYRPKAQDLIRLHILNQADSASREVWYAVMISCKLSLYLECEKCKTVYPYHGNFCVGGDSNS